MDPAIFPYLACVLGAVAVFLLLRPGVRAVKGAGIVLGLAGVGGLLVEIAKQLTPLGDPAKPGPFFLMFSLVAIACAVRMITHHKPVYSALYFVMVVLSTAGLFLLLEAEFMAFALIIVYAGAILITYMFVLMLAQQAPDADHPDNQPDYDRVAREPMFASIVGFMMLAIFTNMVVKGTPELTPAGHEAATVVLAGDPNPSNVQLVGLDLVHKFPVSLELAGVILLMAMFGAVVLARKQIELGEDETREAAGMSKLGFHGDDTEHIAAATGDGGKP